MIHNFWKKMRTSEPRVTTPPCHTAPSRSLLAPGLPPWECCRPPLPWQGPFGITATLREVCLLDPNPQQAPCDPSPSTLVSLGCASHCDYTWWIFFHLCLATGWPPPRTGARPLPSLSHPRAWLRRGTPTPVRQEDKGATAADSHRWRARANLLSTFQKTFM